MNNATTNHLLNYPQFSALAQVSRISETELLAALVRCIRFLPRRFRLMLAGGKA